MKSNQVNFYQKLQIITIISLLFFSSCASLGGNIIYRTSQKQEVKTLGFVNLNQDTILNKEFLGISEVYGKQMLSSFNENGKGGTIQIKEYLDYQKPDSASIVSICKKFNLDAVVLGNIYLKGVRRISGTEWNSEIFLNVYSKDAQLLYKVGYNTKIGNGYFFLPTWQTSIKDAIKGSTQHLLKVL